MNVLQVFILAFYVGTLNCQTLTQKDVDGNITFTVYVKNSNLVYNSTFNDSQLSVNCPAPTNVTLMIHGWTESIKHGWVKPLIDAYLTHAGGCVIFMDYSKYSVVGDYFVLVEKYNLILNTLIKKILQIGNPERLSVFGFSFGSRLAQGAGYNLTMVNKGVPVIKKMDLCDPAGPGFDNHARAIKDPSKSAVNCACINTSSNDKGTTIFDCKQNFLMGYCGQWQYAATVSPFMSHGLCPYIFINSFTTAFVNYNYHKCTHARMISNSTAVGARLGYYNTNFFNGTMFIATSRCKPYLLENGKIYNYPVGKPDCA